MESHVTHEEFLQAVYNHLKEREGCPIVVIVHSLTGMEMQMNFMDYAIQMGMMKAAKMTVESAFRRQLEIQYKSGENQMMVSNIKDAINSDKKKPN